jgi:HAD superfamily hydrolase (TIGR01490 family)
MNLTLFDLDGTLLPLDSDHAFGEFIVRQGWCDDAAYRARNDAFYADYQAGCLDMPAYIDFATASWRDRPSAQIEQLSRQFMHEIIEPALRDEARGLIERHRRLGDELVLITATNDFITAPIARAFGIATLIATELERDAGGRVTGRMRGAPALREGKVTRVAQWLATGDRAWADFDRITFYSDSTNDLPLLERVTHPVATNPGAELERIARERHWPILRLFE